MRGKGGITGTLLLALLVLVGQWANEAQPIVGPSSLEEAVLYQEDFEDGQAQGWQWEGAWAVVRDWDGNYVLRGREHNGASYTGDAWGDYTLKLRVKIIRGRIHLNYRVSGCTRYFIGFEEEKLDLNKTSPCGTHRELRSRERYHARGRWYEVKIVGKGNKIEIYVDGWLVLSFVDPSPLLYGGIALETLDDSEFYVDDVTVLGQRPPTFGLRWVKTGGPPGGIGYDVRIDPRNPKIIYVTDAWAGLHKSVDSGETWVAMNEGIISRAGSSGDAVPIFCVTIDPSNSDILWAGTLQAKGVYRSTDGGAHWVLRVNGITDFPSDHTPTVRSFAVDPRNSQVVLAALEIQDPLSKSYGQIYKTTSGGEYWRKVLQAGNLFRRIEIDPRNPDVIYAGSGIFDRLGGFEGIFKSTDGGETWFKVNNGLTNLVAPYLAISPDDSRVIYTATGREPEFGGNPDGGVFRSRDGGEHWEKLLSPDWGVVGVVVVAPSDANRLYAAIEEHVYRSTDGGRTWTHLGFNAPGYRMGIPIGMDVDPTNPDIVYLNGYGGGVYRSKDGGRSWESANRGYTGAAVRDIAVDPQARERFYVAALSGVFKSLNGGVDYQGLNEQNNKFEFARTVAIDPHDSTVVYAANEWSGRVFKSSDGGRTWVELGRLSPPVAGIKTGGIYIGITEIIVSPRDGRTLYLSTVVGREQDPRELRQNEGLGIFKSTDGGRSWQTINKGLPSLQVLALVADPKNPDILWAGTLDGGVARSTNGGVNWALLNSGLSSLEVRVLAIDPQDSQIIYAGTGDASIFKSTDAGQRWRWIGAGMDPQATVRAIAVNPANPQEVFAADWRTGIYRSTNGGQTWQRCSDGLRTRAVLALAFSTDGKTLYAGTEGEGVFRLDLPGASGR